MMILSQRFSTYAQLRGRKTLVSKLFLFLSIRRERNSLKNLDAHMLQDIGVTQAQATREATRPVWDAPSRWMS